MTPQVDEDGKPLKLSHMILEGSLTASHSQMCTFSVVSNSMSRYCPREKKIKKEWNQYIHKASWKCIPGSAA